MSGQDRSSRPADTDTSSAHALPVREPSATSILHLFIGASLALRFLGFRWIAQREHPTYEPSEYKNHEDAGSNRSNGTRTRTPAPDLGSECVAVALTAGRYRWPALGRRPGRGGSFTGTGSGGRPILFAVWPIEAVTASWTNADRLRR